MSIAATLAIVIASLVFVSLRAEADMHTDKDQRRDIGIGIPESDLLLRTGI